MNISIGKYCSLILKSWRHEFVWVLQSRNIHTNIRYPVGVYILPAEKDLPFEIFFQLLGDYEEMSAAVKFLL
jgi:hypothetical protein